MELNITTQTRCRLTYTTDENDYLYSLTDFSHPEELSVVIVYLMMSPVFTRNKGDHRY